MSAKPGIKYPAVPSIRHALGIELDSLEEQSDATQQENALDEARRFGYSYAR